MYFFACVTLNHIILPMLTTATHISNYYVFWIDSSLCNHLWPVFPMISFPSLSNHSSHQPSLSIFIAVVLQSLLGAFPFLLCIESDTVVTVNRHGYLLQEPQGWQSSLSGHLFPVSTPGPLAVACQLGSFGLFHVVSISLGFCLWVLNVLIWLCHFCAY